MAASSFAGSPAVRADAYVRVSVHGGVPAAWLGPDEAERHGTVVLSGPAAMHGQDVVSRLAKEIKTRFRIPPTIQVRSNTTHSEAHSGQ